MPAPRACLDCGEPVHPRARFSYCAEHKKRICHTCGNRLPEGKQFDECSDCTAQRIERTLARKGRLCAVCRRRPATPRSFRCSDCHHADYVEDRQLLLNIRRNCGTCGVRMDAGRYAYHCPKCAAKRRMEQSRGKPCAHCGKSPRHKDRSYCHPCWLMLGTLWRSARRGDKTAQRLLKIQPRQKWVGKKEGRNEGI